MQFISLKQNFIIIIAKIAIFFNYNMRVVSGRWFACCEV